MDELKSINELYYHAKMLLNLRRKTNTSRIGNFTVFTALRNETDEEKAHTTFLYETQLPRILGRKQRICWCQLSSYRYR